MSRTSVLALVLIAGFSSAESAPSKQIKAIEADVSYIETIDDAPGNTGYHPIQKTLPNWQFEGLFEGSKPVRLWGTYQEGDVNMDETYYLLREKLLLVKTESWWDVEDDRKAPPNKEHRFYIDKDYIIRDVYEEKSSPPKTQTDDTRRAAAAFVERSRLITQILLGTAKDPAAAAHSLEAFPETESNKPSKNELATVDFPEVRMSLLIPFQREYPEEKRPIHLPSSVIRHFKAPESLKADGLQGEYRTQKLPWGIVYEWNTPTKGSAYFSYACRRGDDFCFKIGPYAMITLDWANATFQKIK